MMSRYKLVFIFVAISLLVVAIVFQQHIFYSPSQNSIHNTLLQSMPSSLDPLKANDTNSQFVINHLYDGLVSWSLEEGIEPMLAQRWEFSTDKKSIVFEVRQQIFFSDGSLVTSKDVVESLKRIILTDNYYKDHFKNVDKIEPLSPNMLKVSLKVPDPKILFLLAGTAALITKRDQSGMFLSTGPYMVSSADKNSISLVSRNDYYGDPPVTKIIKFHILSSKGIMSMVENQEIDDSIIDSSPIQYQRTKHDSWQQVNMWATWGIGFDTRNSVAKNKGIRMVLSRVLRSEAFVNQIFPGQQFAYGLIPFGLSGALNGPSHTDVKFDKINETDQQLEIYVPSEVPQKQKIINWIDDNVKSTPIKFKIVEQGFSNIVTDLGSGKMGAFLLSFNAEYPSPYFYLDSMLSDGKSNFFGINSNEIKKISADFDASKDPASNSEVLRQINLYTIKEGLFIPLMHIKHNAWMRDCVSGVEFSPLSEGYFSLRKVRNTCHH